MYLDVLDPYLLGGYRFLHRSTWVDPGVTQTCRGPTHLEGGIQRDKPKETPN